MNLKIVIIVLMLCFLAGSIQTAVTNTINRASATTYPDKPGIVAMAVSNFINSASNFEGEMVCP